MLFKTSIIWSIIVYLEGINLNKIILFMGEYSISIYLVFQLQWIAINLANGYMTAQ